MFWTFAPVVLAVIKFKIPLRAASRRESKRDAVARLAQDKRARASLAILALVAGLAFVSGCSSEDRDGKHGERDRGDRDRKEAHAVTPAMLEQGRTLYKANCAACHGETGKGDGPAAGVLKPPPRDHTDRAYMDTLSDEDMERVIKMGGAIKGKPLMPSHPQFKEAELHALVGYVRSLSVKK